MSTVWLDLLALAVYGPLVVLLHELGHAIFARAGGYRITAFGIRIRAAAIARTSSDQSSVS